MKNLPFIQILFISLIISSCAGSRNRYSTIKFQKQRYNNGNFISEINPKRSHENNYVTDNLNNRVDHNSVIPSIDYQMSFPEDCDTVKANVETEVALRIKGVSPIHVTSSKQPCSSCLLLQEIIYNKMSSLVATLPKRIEAKHTPREYKDTKLQLFTLAWLFVGLAILGVFLMIAYGHALQQSIVWLIGLIIFFLLFGLVLGLIARSLE